MTTEPPIKGARLPAFTRDATRLAADARDLSRTLRAPEADDPEMYEALALAYQSLSLSMFRVCRTMEGAILERRAAERAEQTEDVTG